MATTIDDLALEMWPVAKFIPYARNPRKNDAVIKKMVAAIKEFGFRIPIVAKSDGTVVDGHLRLKAAQVLELKEVPVVLADNLTDAQVKAFRILANRSASWAEWDDELLRLEVADLQLEDYPLELTGFSKKELDLLLMADIGAGLTDPDDVPDVEEIVSKTGDIWVLGNHRLMCGDSTSKEDVAALLDGVSPTLMVTDPPYGVEYDPKRRVEHGLTKETKKMGKVENDDRADWREAWALFPGSVAYVWHASLFTGDVAESLRACGFAIRNQIIWAKDRFALSRGHYHWQHEPCWYAVKGTAHWNGDRKQSTVWNINARDDEGHGHGTQKPVECMLRPIMNNSSPGQAVYEPFSGSGTTIIAAEKSGRVCYAMELSPKYVDIAVKRWELFTGKKAQKHEGAGTTANQA